MMSEHSRIFTNDYIIYSKLFIEFVFDVYHKNYALETDANFRESYYL